MKYLILFSLFIGSVSQAVECLGTNEYEQDIYKSLGADLYRRQFEFCLDENTRELEKERQAEPLHCQTFGDGNDSMTFCNK